MPAIGRQERGFSNVGLIDMLERLLIPSRKPKRVGLKEIVCKTSAGDLIKTLKTSAVGSQYRNIDGSDRQATIQKLKPGERVRLIWDAGEDGNKKTIYLVRGAKTQEFSMSDCFGRLNDKVAEEVIRGLNRILTVNHVIGIIMSTNGAQ